MRLRELRDRRGQLIAQIRAIADAAGNNALSAEQQTEYDRIFAEQRALQTQIENEERLVEIEREQRAAAFAGGQGAPGNGERRDGPGDPPAPETRGAPAGREDRHAAFLAEQRTHPRAQAGFRTAFRSFLRNGLSALSGDETRALQAGTGAEGGFLTVPMQMAADILRAADNQLWIRQLATVVPLAGAQSLGITTLETDPDDADWTSELAIGSEDASMAFGRRQQTPHPLAKWAKISNDLLRLSSDVEGLVRSRIEYKFGVTEEKNYLTGDGQGKPLGVFVASSDGVPSSRDYSTGNTTTAFTYDGLVGAKYSLRAPYRANASWLFHRDGIRQAALLKDSAGLPLWQPSLQEGQPDRLLGHPVRESEYVPNTFTAGQYVGAFADWRFYQIVDAYDIQVQRLVELFAGSNQIAVIMRRKLDGQPVMGEAFARIKLAAS